ncbi:MAG TPA: MarP family serine protease, partial [Pseudonocardia sp.]|nr:MarP family serine protease [Pseudonocardia sp.]
MEVAGVSPNLMDGVLVLLLVYVTVRGWRQGALSQVAAFAGLAAGLLAGAWLAPRVTALVTGGPGPNAALLTLGLLVVAVLVGQGIGVAVGLRLRRAVDRVGVLSTADRAAGIGVGAVGLALVVWLLAGVLVNGPWPVLAQQLRGSQVVQALDRALPPTPDVVGRITAYLDRQGFPQVFAGLGGTTLPPAPEASPGAVQAAAAAGQPSTVQVLASGCGATGSAGSGFVPEPGYVVTNAHVVAGFDQVSVRDAGGRHPATVIGFDPALDVAVLAAPDVTAPPIGFSDTPAEAGTEGATLGFPGGQRQMVVLPATVRGRLDAVGRDIYGGQTVRREILVLAAPVEQGDSGGPFVTADGRVGGVVFAGDPGDRGTGYALTADAVQPRVEAAIGAGQAADVGACR